jgi:hypothetical protein
MTVRSLSCPSCGAAITLRALAWTQTVVCASCGSVLDARDPSLAILQKLDKALRITPAIPLGTRGQWRGAPYEVIGFQVRKIVVDEMGYFWREYLLFNPYHGFRYLTEYDGHWNDVVPLPAAPMSVAHQGKRGMRAAGRSFRHFQSATATTTLIVGEFPWEVRAGDEVEARDYVDPPFLLSAEETKEEVTWSVGEYVDGAEVWRAFKAPGQPPQRKGVFANQPSPLAPFAGIWKPFGVLAAALLVLMLLRLVTADAREVHRGSYPLHRPDTVPTVFVTPAFDLAGDRANVAVDLDTDASNSWVALDYTLIEENTGAAYDFGREVSYYSGVDSDGSWTEGSRRDRARIANIPGGRYFLRVETIGQTFGQPVTGTLRVRRDVPSFLPFFLALLALALPPGILALRAHAFETRRWAESDYAPKTADDDPEDE